MEDILQGNVKSEWSCRPFYKVLNVNPRDCVFRYIHVRDESLLDDLEMIFSTHKLEIRLYTENVYIVGIEGGCNGFSYYIVVTDKTLYSKVLVKKIKADLSDNFIIQESVRSGAKNLSKIPRNCDNIIASYDFWPNIKRACDKLKMGKINYINLLFTGPPGAGKTQMAIAVASYMSCSLSICSIFDMPTHPKGIIFIEEIDKAINDNSEFNDKVDISVLLQILDGAMRKRETLLIMTCNNPELIMRNSILSRDGRIHRKYHFGFVTKAQVISAIDQYYTKGEYFDKEKTMPVMGDVGDDYREQFYAKLNKETKKGITIAQVNTFIMNCYIDDISFERILTLPMNFSYQKQMSNIYI